MLGGLSAWMFTSFLLSPNNHNEGEEEFYELEANFDYFLWPLETIIYHLCLKVCQYRK